MAKRMRFCSGLSKRLEIPEDTLGMVCRLQWIGNTVTVSGVRKILKYSCEEITVLTREGTLTFQGEHLKCAYFFEATVELCGEIISVVLEKR